MLMPSIFGESLFDDFDNLMNFSFPDVDKTLYGKHAKNMMKTENSFWRRCRSRGLPGWWM